MARRKGSGKDKDTCINFSLSVAEKKIIAERAKSMGLGMSAYIRYKLLYENKE